MKNLQNRGSRVLKLVLEYQGNYKRPGYRYCCRFIGRIFAVLGCPFLAKCVALTQKTWREQIDELESSQGGGESSNLNSKIALEQIDDCSGGRVGCSKCEACV